MPPVLFPLATTTQINFSNLLIDPSSSYTGVLAQATSARTKVFLALQAVAEHQPGANALAIVDSIKGYLPYLRGIAECLENDQLLFQGEPVFTWRASLTHYSLSPPLLPLPSIHTEYLMILLTYTLALSNFAHSILASLPSFEPSQSQSTRTHMSADDEKRTTAGLARAVDLLCQASGIADWTAEEICPKLEGVKKTIGRLGKYRWPIESGQDLYRGLSMMLLADAHVTAIRKLLLPVLSHVIFSPAGPPLPSNHPSPSLLAKLHLHIAQLYNFAQARLGVKESPPRKLFSSDKDKDCIDDAEGEIIPEIKRYLRKESRLAGALGRKWLGVDAGENGKGAKVGEALAWVKDAQGRLQEMEGGAVREKMKVLSIGKASEKRKEERIARRGRVERDLEDVAAWIKAYQRMNDTVAFQPVPSVSSLVTPSGRPIFAPKSFTPPASKFISSSHSDEEVHEHSPDLEKYAGKGNYF